MLFLSFGLIFFFPTCFDFHFNAQQNFPCSGGTGRSANCGGRRAESSNPSIPHPTHTPPPSAANHPIKSPISGIMTAKEGGNRPESAGIWATINSP